MLKQFIIGIFSSAVAHRLFPPPTNNGKSRGRGCILRLLATLIFIGLLCWAVGYGIVVAPTYTLLTLYAGLKFLATNIFVAIDKLFHPGFDAPAPLIWGGWGLIGGTAIQGFREMRSSGRKGLGVLTALMPLVLLGITGVIKNVNVPEPSSLITTTVEQNTSGLQRRPIKSTKPIPTVPKKTTQDAAPQFATQRREPVRTNTKQNTGTIPATVPKPSTPSLPLDMVLIPAGEFQMGSNAGADEQPVHTVYIDAFYMDKYEVTNAQYKKFLDANPSWRKGRILSVYHDGDYLKHWNGNNYPRDKANHPVTYVSWYGAMAYAKWAGKRLPTEAEWEKAARGGLTNKKYPWGNLIDPSKANYNKKVGDTTSVGKYSANDFGLYDMAGNVLEWCLDGYDEDFYKSSSSRNPIAGGTQINITTNFSKVTTERVLRGGSWSVLPQSVDVADRTKGNPTLSYFGAGFRCVRAVIPTMTKTSITDTEKKTTTHRNPVRMTTDTPNAVAKARIQKVWVDYNQYQDSVKGMRIHVKFNVDNFKDAKGRVVAYFYYKVNGHPLKDTNGSYNTTSDNVSTGRNFQPNYLKSTYNDYTLFMPYKELHLGRGKHDLKFYIEIFDSSTWTALSDKSDWVHFTASQ